MQQVQSKVRRLQSRRRIMYSTAAASIALLFVLWLMIQPGTQEFYTNNEMERILLPDQSCRFD